MSSVLNRTTKQYLQSANTPDYPIEEWIHNPDMSAVAGQPSKYWVITGDNVTLMTAQEQSDADAAISTAQRGESVAQNLDDVESILRAFASVVVDEINILRQQHALPDRTLTQLRSAILSKMGA